MEKLKAVILAGGYGTRLRPLTYTRPKPMLPLFGRPVLEHIIKFLVKHGFYEIVITTNYLSRCIIDYFGNGSEFGVEISYSEEREPLGTAGSVKNVEKHLNDSFAVIQGDNITDIDFTSVFEFHRKRHGIATITLVSVDDPSDFGVAELGQSSEVVRFVEKPKPGECFSNLANTGLYVLEPEILDYIPRDSPYDFSKDLFPKLLGIGEKIYGYKAEGYWMDVGRPESYQRCNEWFLSRMKSSNIAADVECRGVDIRDPVFIGKNVKIGDGAKILGPLVISDGCQIDSDSTIVNSTIGANVKIGRETRVLNSIIYENTLIGEASSFDQCIVDEHCKVGSRVNLGRRSIIGANCRIGDAVEIQPETRVWPGMEVDAHSVVRGILRYHLEMLSE